MTVPLPDHLVLIHPQHPFPSAAFEYFVTQKLSRGLPGVGHFSVITSPFGGSLLLYQNQVGKRDASWQALGGLGEYFLNFCFQVHRHEFSNSNTNS